MPVTVPTAATPLFERLCGPVPTAGSGRLDATGLRQSVTAALARLLNTRSRLTVAQYLSEPLTVIDYGLPDFTALAPGSRGDVAQVRDAVARAIERFEPRLSRVQVTASRDAVRRERIAIGIDAAVRLGEGMHRVRFDAALGAGGEA